MLHMPIFILLCHGARDGYHDNTIREFKLYHWLSLSACWKICFITNLLLTLLLAVDVRRDLLAVASLWHSVFMLSSASGQLIRVLGKVCI